MSLIALFGNEPRAILKALDRSQAVIEFTPTGTILTANANFCGAVGYSLSEIVGKHHSMFVAPDYARSPEYKSFWARLGRGEFFSAQYKRFGKGGRESGLRPLTTPSCAAANRTR